MTSPVSVNITIAEPSPLGVFGLALITFVASSQKLGFTTGSSLLIPWALFLGCGAQLIACFMDYKKTMCMEPQSLGLLLCSGLQCPFHGSSWAGLLAKSWH